MVMLLCGLEVMRRLSWISPRCTGVSATSKAPPTHCSAGRSAGSSLASRWSASRAPSSCHISAGSVPASGVDRRGS